MPWNMYYAGQEVLTGISLNTVDLLTKQYLDACDNPEGHWFDLHGTDDNGNVAITRLLASPHIPVSFLPA